MKKILLTLALFSLASIASAQFVVSAQLGGSFSQGSSAFESVYQGPSPLTGDDTVITQTGGGDFDKPLALSAGVKIGYQTGKMQFGLAARFSFNRLYGNQNAEDYIANNPNTEAIDHRPVDTLFGYFTQYRTGFSIAPYVRYELIQLGDIAFFAELNAYYTRANHSHRHDFLDWTRREMHYTIDTSLSIPESSVSIGAKITPGLSWQISPHCSIDLYLDIIAFSFDHTVLSKRTIIDEYDYTTTPRVLGRRTTIDVTATSNTLGFAVSGSTLLPERNWVRVGFNYTF